MKAVQPIRDMELLDKCLFIAREHDKNRKKGEVSWELLLIVGFKYQPAHIGYTSVQGEGLERQGLRRD